MDASDGRGSSAKQVVDCLQPYYPGSSCPACGLKRGAVTGSAAGPQRSARLLGSAGPALQSLCWYTNGVASESLVYFSMCYLWPPSRSVCKSLSRQIPALRASLQGSRRPCSLGQFGASWASLERTGVHSL